jgi:hypothetical protein
MVNPYNSPWLKTTTKSTGPRVYPVIIFDPMLKKRYSEILNFATNKMEVAEYNGILRINKQIYLAKKSYKFRIISHLDWAWYTPKTLADAIDNDSVEAYYETMLKDVSSDPNVWKDSDFEIELKTFYAIRNGRASDI